MSLMTHEQKLSHVQNTLGPMLRESSYFLSLPEHERVHVYRDLLSAGMSALENGNLRPAVRALAEDDLDPTRISDVGELAGGFLDQVDFPQFVRDLITGVYGSIVQSSIDQMMAYVDFYKELSKPLSALAKDIADADALGEVATRDPLRFTMGGDGSLMDNDTGMQLDTSNDEVQRLMFEAKLALARERRLLMRETMMMGLQRLIVKEGTIRAGLVFNIQSREQFGANQRTTDIQQQNKQFGGGFLGFFGGGNTKNQTKITVSSRQLTTDTNLNAQVTGHVEVKFASDYFELNRFAELFGDESTRAEVEQRNGATPAQAPVAR